MTEFRVLTETELRPILDLLTSLPEHTLLTELPDIVNRLGWTLQARRIGQTNLPVSFRLFAASSLGNQNGEKELVGISFRVTDTLPDESAASQRTVAAALPGLVAAVTSCLGFGPTRKKWATPGETWDLPDGKQVNLYQGEDVIELQAWAKERADIERHEISHGIDPAHNLDDRPW